MPKGVVSAYEAGKEWGVHPDTVKKWIQNGKVKGHAKNFGDGIVRYYVQDKEISRIKDRLVKDREKGKSLLEE